MKKYKISFQGWDTEVLISDSTEKMYNHFKENELDVSLHMCGTMEDELSDDITDGVCYDSKFECDNLYHNCGPNLDNSVTMYVIEEESGKEVYSSCLDFAGEYKYDTDCEEDVVFNAFESDYILVGQIFSKGYSAEYLLELNDDEEFDASKIIILYHDINEWYQIISNVQYDDTTLECTGEISTTGKDERWFIFDTETGEQTID